MKKTEDSKNHVASLRKARLKSKPSLIGKAAVGVIMHWMRELQLEESYAAYTKTYKEKQLPELLPREFIQDYMSK
jgi:hypothetical protein